MKNNQIILAEGLIALNQTEMTQTFGGGWWQDFKTGFMEGWNWAKGAAGEIATILTIAGKMRKA